MFESIQINCTGDFANKKLDTGNLAEKLIFFNKIYITASISQIPNMIENVGSYEFADLLFSERINLIIAEDMLGISTDRKTGIPTHGIITFKMSGNSAQNRFHSNIEALEHLINRKNFEKKYTNRIIDLIEKKSKFIKISGDLFEGEQLLNYFDDNIFKREWSEPLIKDILHSVDSTNQWKQKIDNSFFHTVKIDDGFRLGTNFDFNHFTQDISLMHNNEKTQITPQLILQTIAQAIVEIQVSTITKSPYSPSLLQTPITRKILNSHFEQIKSINKDIADFQSMTFNNFRAISDAVEKDEMKFSEIIKILNQKEKFDQFLASIGKDKKLAEEYLMLINSKKPINKLPLKIMEYISVIGSSALYEFTSPYLGASTILGVSYAVFDKITKKEPKSEWNPELFIDGPLKRTISD